MKIICFDPGTVRIGAAISDETAYLARPLEFIKVNERLDINLLELAKRDPFEVIVVGNPLNMDGTKNPHTKHGDELVERLTRLFPDIPLVLRDERLTTREANDIMIRADMSRKKRKKKVDSLAAVLILQGYLDHLRSGKK